MSERVGLSRLIASSNLIHLGCSTYVQDSSKAESETELVTVQIEASAGVAIEVIPELELFVLPPDRIILSIRLLLARRRNRPSCPSCF